MSQSVAKTCPITAPSEGPLDRAFVICIPWGTAFAAFGGVMVFGKVLAGFAWVVQALLAVLVIATSHRRRSMFPLLMWMPWIFYILLRCEWGDFITIQRTFMLITPFLVGWAAGTITDGRQLRFLLDSFKPVTIVLTTLFVISAVGTMPFGLRFQFQGSGMTLFMAAACFTHGVYRRDRKAIVLFAACLAVCALSGLRMDTALCLLAIVIYPIGIILRTRVMLTILIFAIGMGTMLLPQINSKMFKQGDQPQRMGEIPDALNTSGRTYAWGLYWEEACKNPIFGAGGDASGRFGKATIMDESQWHHPHNEGLRVFFDYGIVGLILLIVPTLALIHRLWRSLWACRNPVLRQGFALSVTVIVLAGVSSLTDNALLNVHFYGNWLFAIIGAVSAVPQPVVRGYR